jgi:Aminoglycoside-2''-adenylyltransferase
MSRAEYVRRWAPWRPGEVRDRLAVVDVPWGVVAGWAIDMHLGVITREHEDIEISVPAASFSAVADALGELEWDVVGSGRIWPYPAMLHRFHQTWVRDPVTGRYHLDVFREPHDGDTWLFRRDRSIALPYVEVYERTTDGVPYLIPELVLLFKSRDVQPKDQADFNRVIPTLTAKRRQRLRRWLAHLDPDHRWLTAL